MKNHKLIILVLAVFLFSCEEENPNINEQNHIDLPLLKEFIPDGYRTASSVFYENQHGETIEFEITYSFRQASHDLQDGSFITMDDYVITLYAPSDGIDIVLLGSAYINGDATKVNPRLLSRIKPFHPSGSAYMDLKIGDNTITSSDFENTFFKESEEINGKKYQEVYSIFDSNLHSYHHLSYNSEFGILSFSDVNNEYWYYKRIE